MSGSGTNLPAVPAAAAAPDVAALQQQLTQARSQVQQTAQVLEQSAAKQEADDRSMITRVIIFVFGGSMAAVLVTIVGLAIYSGKTDLVAEQVVDLLKSVVLPVVTLVLGYYFGRAGKG